jgi:hypothetical protein
MTEPVDHAARLTRAELVKSKGLTQVPLEGDLQQAGLARSVTRPIPWWPVNHLQRTALSAAVDAELWVGKSEKYVL